MLGSGTTFVGIGVRTVGNHERNHQFGRVVENLAAADPTLHRLGVTAVAGQVGAPPILHRIEQRQTRLAVLHPHEPHRPRVMRSGRGQRLGHRGLDHRRVDGFVAELAHRAPQQLSLRTTEGDGLLGAQPEQILLAGPHQRARRGPVVVQLQPPHHGDRHRGQLALHQIGGRGDLVGDGDLGDDQFVAVPIVFARVAVQHRQPGRADRDVGLTGAPGAAHGVGDHHTHAHPESLTQLLHQPSRTAVGIDGQQRQFGGVDIRAVHPGRGLHQTQRVLGDQRAPLAGQHPHRLGVDQPAPQRVPQLRIGRCVDHPALTFGEHLAGDHDHIVVVQPRRRLCESRGEVVAGPKLRQAGHGKQFHPRRRAVVGHGVTPASSMPARTISAVTAGSVINSGTARTSTPGTVA